MKTNTKAELEEARQSLVDAQTKISKLEKRLAAEQAFESDTTVHVVTRRAIDNGRFVCIEGVFETFESASMYAKLLPGYGLGQDLLIDSFPLYR